MLSGRGRRVGAQQFDQFARERRQQIEAAHADLHSAQGPFVCELDDADVQRLPVACRRGFRQDADAHPSLDHAAGRLEVADLDAQLDRAVHLVGDLVQERVDRTRFVQADVVERQRIGERHRLAPCECVVGRDAEHQPVLPVGHDLQPLGAHVARDDADVGLAFADRAHDVARQPLAQVDVDIRVGRQVAAQNGGQELGDRGGAGEHAQVALHALGVLLQVAAQVFDLVQHQPRVVGKSLAGRRQRHALAAAVQQLAAQAFLEVLDAHAGRGQRQVRTLGAACQAVAVGDVDEQPQVDEIEMHGPDCRAVAKVVNDAPISRPPALAEHTNTR